MVDCSLQKKRLLKFVVGPKLVASYVRGRLADTVDISLPVENLGKGEYRLVLASEVEVYDGMVLEGGDSVITAPTIVPRRINIDDGAGYVKASYAPGARIGEIVPEFEGE